MKRRYIVALIVLVLMAIITVFLLWFYNSSPRLNADNISSIQQFRMPSPPEIITVNDAETIKQFAGYFNALEFTPILTIRLPGGGWHARDVIELKNSGMTYNIVFEQAYEDYMLVKVNHRYYKVGLDAYKELLDIISDKQ